MQKAKVLRLKKEEKDYINEELLKKLLEGESF